MTPHAKQIINTLEQVERYGYRLAEVFTDWLEVSALALESLPKQLQSILENGCLLEEGDQMPKAIQERYARNLPAITSIFARAFTTLLDGGYPDGKTPSYHDLVGEVFENGGLINANKGQFFTPAAVSELAARAVLRGTEELVMQHLKDAVAHSPMYQMGEIIGVNWSFESLFAIANQIKATYYPVKIQDPACGSGGMLLAAARVLSETMPEWVLQRGLVGFYGQDIDYRCTLMARINLALYGLNGNAVFLVQTTETADNGTTTVCDL